MNKETIVYRWVKASEKPLPDGEEPGEERHVMYFGHPRIIKWKGLYWHWGRLESGTVNSKHYDLEYLEEASLSSLSPLKEAVRWMAREIADVSGAGRNRKYYIGMEEAAFDSGMERAYKNCKEYLLSLIKEIKEIK